jgi:hypothetical protein
MNTLQWHHISSPVMQLVKLHLIYPYWAIWSVLMRYLYNIKSIILLNTPATPPPETCSIYYLAIFELFQISLLPQHVPQPTSLLLYTKCFSTLRCWDGHVGTPLCRNTCAGGGNFRKNGVWLSLYDVVVSWLRLQTPIDGIPHPYWMYAKCFSTLISCGWAYGCTLMP